MLRVRDDMINDIVSFLTEPPYFKPLTDKTIVWLEETLSLYILEFYRDKRKEFELTFNRNDNKWDIVGNVDEFFNNILPEILEWLGYDKYVETIDQLNDIDDKEIIDKIIECLFSGVGRFYKRYDYLRTNIDY